MLQTICYKQYVTNNSLSFINQVRIKLNGFETYIKIKLKYFKENSCIICITKNELFA